MVFDGLVAAKTSRLRVLDLHNGERGGVSPLILQVKSFELGSLVNSYRFIPSNLFAQTRTKNQGAYAAPLAKSIPNCVNSKLARSGAHTSQRLRNGAASIVGS
jgi:hypothetical protein